MIRLARAGDAHAVLDLWSASRSAAAVTADTPEAVARVIEAGALLVAERDGLIVGALVAAWDGWRGNMYRLAVRQEHRRQGIGLALVREGHELLRGKGAVRVTALVAHDEEDATGLWEAAGYSRDRQIARFVRNL